MKRTILGTTAVCILICGCAASKSSIPTEASEASPYESRLASMAAVAMERENRQREQSGLMQKIQELGNELAELKSRLTASTAAPAPDTTGAAVPALQTAAAPVSPVTATASAAEAATRAGATRPKAGKPGARTGAAARATNRETIVIQDKGMIFRVMHEFAKTDFHPSKSLQEQLLKAARAGKTIEIRGRTDAATSNPADRAIALQRALNARVFLANNGIHPRKMHVNYMAAGDNVADNSTADGRARNRRVDIETAGIAPEVLENLAALIRQDLQ